MKLEHDLLTNDNTEVLHEDDYKYNAPHHFMVIKSGCAEGDTIDTDGILATVDFQEGPIKEVGLNGVFNEDLIAMVICRLQHFQQSEFSCRESATAITKLEEALLWLRKRTMGRQKRGVQGTSCK